jgi:hypothetical protein
MRRGARRNTIEHDGCATRTRTRIAVAAAVASLALLLAAPARTADADQTCLACHSAAGMEKTLGDGNKLSLHIDGDLFAKSVHTVVGCTGCHMDVDLNSHPPAAKEIKSAREFALATVELCKNCHADKFEQWEGSVHAAMVREGNPRAPICTDCHNPHAVIKDAAATIERIPCQKCHQPIYQAYLGSVHAKARLAPETSYAPLCTGCHTAHSVKPVVSAEGPKVACLGCHAEVLEKHQAWLPNAALHFEVVSCPACHSPTAHRKVDLMIYDKATQAQVQEQHGVPIFERRPGADKGESLDALALWQLVSSLNPDNQPDNIVLRGRLEVQTGPQAHMLTPASQAIRECSTCHSRGSAAFENVTVSVAGPDGRRIKQVASPGVLTSAISTSSLGGFYAIGGTRVGLLDILLILSFLGGLGFWVGHSTIRWLYKHYSLYRPEA